MKETVFKVEVDEELVDMLQIRIQDKFEIEIFVLTQALGLLELLIQRRILTSQCKKSVLSFSTEVALRELRASNDVIDVISRAAQMQGTILSVTDEVVEQSKELKEKTLRLLEERLSQEQARIREWAELFDLDVRELRRMHNKVQAKQQKELEEMVKKREQELLTI